MPQQKKRKSEEVSRDDEDAELELAEVDYASKKKGAATKKPYIYKPVNLCTILVN
jgi:hypothetical protein